MFIFIFLSTNSLTNFCTDTLLQFLFACVIYVLVFKFKSLVGKHVIFINYNEIVHPSNQTKDYFLA